VRPVSKLGAKRLCCGAILAIMVASGTSSSWALENNGGGSLQDKESLLGVIDRKGVWIIPCRFQRVLYISSTQMFWASTKPPPTNTAVIHNSSESNPDWIMFDRKGHRVESQLPEGCEPIFEWTPSQAAMGTSFFADAVLVGSRSGYGVSNSFGKLMMPCKYERLDDVGEDRFVAKARPIKLDTLVSSLVESIAPNSVPDEGFVQPYELFDHKGGYIATLPTTVKGFPEGHFVDGLLKIGRVVVNKFGKIVFDENSRTLPDSLARAYDFQNRNHGFVYRMAGDSLTPIKFLSDSNSPEYADAVYAAPIFVTANRAIVIQRREDGTRTGLVDEKGRWIVKPKSRVFAYCCDDRFISSAEE
jgi:hypothetical protein